MWIGKFGRRWIWKCKKNGEKVFNVKIGQMSESNIIKYCRDEWIDHDCDNEEAVEGDKVYELFMKLVGVCGIIKTIK